MDVASIAQLFDIGIIIGILLLCDIIKDRLHKSLELDNGKIDYKIMPFVPFILGIFAGFTVVFRDPEVANSFWNVVWEAIKYGGAATFLYKLWSRFGRDGVKHYLRKKLGMGNEQDS